MFFFCFFFQFEELLGPKDPKTGKEKKLGVFCTKECLAQAKQHGKSAKLFARKLLLGVFTPEALKECSLSGDLFKAGGRDHMVRKPRLDPKGVNAR